MNPDDKKKKKPPTDDENPFDLEDESMDLLNEQFKKIFEGMFSGMNLNVDGETKKMFNRTFREMLKKMGDPAMFQNMDPKEMEKQLKKMGIQGPFVWGMNINFGPDGRPIVGSFGNIKPKKQGEPEVQKERDPLIDIYEDNGQLIVVAEVPGVEKEDIELHASPMELEVIAKSRDEGPQQRNYHKVIPLPSEIDPNIAKARYQNGILEVRLTITGKKTGQKKIKID